MKPQSISGFVLALAVMVGMVFAPSPREESPSAEAAPAFVTPDSEGSLMSSAGASEAPSFASDPRGAQGYCTFDCSRCSSTAECLARGAGSCTSIPACRQ